MKKYARNHTFDQENSRFKDNLVYFHKFPIKGRKSTLMLCGYDGVEVTLFGSPDNRLHIDGPFDAFKYIGSRVSE